MKKYFLLTVMALMPVLSMLAQDRPVTGKVLLNGKEIDAEYTISGGVASLGSGRNACIPQYSQGRVIVPKEITVDETTYPVTDISPMAFRLCNSISFVQLPEGLTHIGNFAFKGCSSLLVLVLPSTLESIGSGAFIGLGLRGIYSLAPTPPRWEYNDVFCRHEGGIGSTQTYSNTTTTLYVPQEYKEAYEHSTFTDSSLGWTTPDGWSYFQNIKGTNDYETEWGLGISTLLALNSFRERVNNGEDFSGKTVKLEADIDMTTQEWDSGIGGGGKTFRKFSGTFDGQGHTVSNLAITIAENNSTIEGLGFFYRVQNATVKDLRIDHFNIVSHSASTQAGGIVAALSSYSHFSNIYVSNSSIYIPGHAGGLVGWAIGSDFNKCVAHSTEAEVGVSSPYGNGGLVGFSQGSQASIRNCAVIGASTPTSKLNDVCIKGPFVGRAEPGISIDYCYTDAQQFYKFVPSSANGYTHGEHVVVTGRELWLPQGYQYREAEGALMKFFLVLPPILGVDDWVYCIGEYPLPDCFEDRYPVEVNKFSLRPATLTTPRPNALSFTTKPTDDEWHSGDYLNTSFKTSSLWIDDNLNANDREHLPIGTATIECVNGVRYDRTLTALENGTRAAEYPVYQTDENGTVVLDVNGQRIPTGETTIVEETVYQPTPYSFCLPYKLTFTSGIHLYEPATTVRTSDDGVSITFNEKDDYVAEAWTPYYALVDADFVPLSTDEHVTLTPNPHITKGTGIYIFEGTDAVTRRSTKDAYVLQSDKTWRKEGDMIPPFRAYFYSDNEQQAPYLQSLVAFYLLNASENSRRIVKNHGLTTDAMILGRSLYRDEAWNTLCLPFDLADFSGTPLADATVMTLQSSAYDAATGTLTLNFETVSAVEAGKPYIVKWTQIDKEIKNPVFMDVTISSQVKNIKTDAVTFCGLFDPLRMKANDKTKLYLGNGNTLYYPDSEMTINAFRAYFQLADGLTAADLPAGNVRLFFGDEEETGVGSLTPAPSAKGEESDYWYAIDGRKLSGRPSQPGVYINKGEKVVIK